MLPKFLIADNQQEQPDLVYVVHNENPRFILQCDLEDIYTDQEIYWIDEQPTNEDTIADLIEEAEVFLENELENELEYDEEEDED
jgi:hypothetical protein